MHLGHKKKRNLLPPLDATNVSFFMTRLLDYCTFCLVGALCQHVSCNFGKQPSHAIKGTIGASRKLLIGSDDYLRFPRNHGLLNKSASIPRLIGIRHAHDGIISDLLTSRHHRKLTSRSAAQMCSFAARLTFYAPMPFAAPPLVFVSM